MTFDGASDMPGRQSRHLFAYHMYVNTLTVPDNGTMSVNQSLIPSYISVKIRLSPCVNTLLYQRYGSLFALNAPNAFLAAE